MYVMQTVYIYTYTQTDKFDCAPSNRFETWVRTKAPGYALLSSEHIVDD